MPTNCWKTDRAIPIQTIGSSPVPLCFRSLKDERDSSTTVRRISAIRSSIPVLRT